MSNSGFMVGEIAGRGVAVTDLVPASGLPAGNPLVGASPALSTPVDTTKTETCAAVLAFFQPGTIPAPAAFVAWRMQPVSPTRGSFEAFISDFINTTIDPIMSVGYNESGRVATEPSLGVHFEADYEVSPGVHIVECYVQFDRAASIGPSFITRPWYFNVDRTSNIGEFQLTLVGPTTEGIFNFRSGDGTVTYYSLDNTSTRWKNNYKNQVLDGGGTARDAWWIDNGAGGGTFVLGDLTNGATWIRGGLNGVASFSDGIWRVRSAAGTTFLATTGGTGLNPADGCLDFNATPGVPAAPATGFRFFIDPGTGALKVIGAGGTITQLALP